MSLNIEAIARKDPEGSIFLPERQQPDGERLIKDFLSMDWERAETILDEIELLLPDQLVRTIDNLCFSLLSVRNGVDADDEVFGDLQVKMYLYDLLMHRRAETLR